MHSRHAAALSAQGLGGTHGACLALTMRRGATGICCACSSRGGRTVATPQAPACLFPCTTCPARQIPPPGTTGWYAHYSSGAPKYHEIWLSQVPVGTSIIYATRYPAGETRAGVGVGGARAAGWEGSPGLGVAGAGRYLLVAGWRVALHAHKQMAGAGGGSAAGDDAAQIECWPATNGGQVARQAGGSAMHDP